MDSLESRRVVGTGFLSLMAIGLPGASVYYAYMNWESVKNMLHGSAVGLSYSELRNASMFHGGRPGLLQQPSEPRIKKSVSQIGTVTPSMASGSLNRNATVHGSKADLSSESRDSRHGSIGQGAPLQHSGECLIVVATPFFGKWKLPYAPKNYPPAPRSCPYALRQYPWPVHELQQASCSNGLAVGISRNLNQVSNADVVIFHSRDDITAVDRYTLKKGAVAVLFSWENHAYTPILRSQESLQKFDHLSISSVRSAVPTYGVGLPPHTGVGSPWLQFPGSMKLSEPMPFDQKRFIVEVSSNCEATREAWVSAMQRTCSELTRKGYANADLHRLGRCGHNSNQLSQIAWTNRAGMVGVTQNYKFMVVFMNANCDYWISERLSLAFQSRLVIIYYGTGRRFLEQFLPQALLSSFIFVEEFETARELIKFVYRLGQNQTAYEEKLQWIRGYNTSLWDNAMKYGPREKACYWCDLCKLRPTIGLRKTKTPEGAEIECHKRLPKD